MGVKEYPIFHFMDDQGFFSQFDSEKRGPGNSSPAHYYGDITRRIFIIGGVVVLLGVPFFVQYLPLPAVLSVFVALILALAAGFVNPKLRIVHIIHLVVSALAVIVFESYAAYMYTYLPLDGTILFLFLITQTLSILFFVALYYSAKTVRGMSGSEPRVEKK